VTSETAWRYGRPTLGTLTRLLTRVEAFGRDRVPASGGLVYAINHVHWVDIPVVGVVSPRNVDFVAKVEAMKYPGLGEFIRVFGTIAVRRGASDRDAVRAMREAARNGHVVGLFVEGARQRDGRPGVAQPGAAMVALQEDVPLMPIAIYGTHLWKPGNFARCSVAFGEPISFPGLQRNGRGYKEATVEIQRRINVLVEWLADEHLRGRVPGRVPPL